MTTFYFNHCIPSGKSIQEIYPKFEMTLKQYSKLKNIEFGIITEKAPSSIFLSKNISLADCINKLDRNFRIYAYKCFNKHPFEFYRTIRDEEYYQLLENKYTLKLSTSEHDASHLAYTYLDHGISFSIELDYYIKQNPLKIEDKNKHVLNINNLYGDEDNTKDISLLLATRNAKDNLELLKIILKYPITCGNFEKEFNNLDSIEQKIIINKFKFALENKYLFPSNPDSSLIKQTSKHYCFELRISSPTLIRIYLYEIRNDKIFLSSVKKGSKEDQTTHITNAESDIIQSLKMH